MESYLEQVSLFKYLGCNFSEDGKIDREIASRKKRGDAVTSQYLSCDTKLIIHRSIVRTTNFMYGSESWVNCGYVMHDLEVANMNVLRRISCTSRREQWENHHH